MSLPILLNPNHCKSEVEFELNMLRMMVTIWVMKVVMMRIEMMMAMMMMMIMMLMMMLKWLVVEPSCGSGAI